MVDRYFVDSYGIEDIDGNGTWVKYEDHQHALAEKDAQVEMMLSIQDNQADLIEQKDTAYQQLMEKAVLFATWLKQTMDNEADEAQDADTFLTSPEVQAWKEQK